MNNLSYVARKKCGCICAAISCDEGVTTRSEMSDAIIRWAKLGLSVEQVTNEVVRRDWGGWQCVHEPKQMQLFDTAERTE